MDDRLTTMTGEELLLVSIFHGQPARAAVARELDRRALLGPPRAYGPRRRRPSGTPVARHSARLVA